MLLAQARPQEPADGAELVREARILEGKGDYLKASELWERIVSIAEKLLGPEDLGTANSLEYLSSAYLNQRRYGEAEPLYKRALAIREKVQGPEHLDTANSLRSLAYLYLNQRRYGEAEPLYKRALAINEKHLGPEHTVLAHHLKQLAFVYARQRRYGEAEPLYKRALAIKEKHLGPEHTVLADDLEQLALLYMNQGRYREAEPIRKRARAIREKLLGLEYPNSGNSLYTANSLRHLALLYGSQGRSQEAEAAQARPLSRGTHQGTVLLVQANPQEPPDGAELARQARVLEEKGDYLQASELWERIVSIAEKLLGPEHPRTANTIEHLALLYGSQGRYGEAELLYKRALAIREVVQGPDHPDTANSLGSLALLYGIQRRYGEAEPLHKRALAINEKVLGPEHPDTANSLRHLALLYGSQSRYGEAEQLHKRALEINEKVLGPGHPVTANSLNNLALAYVNQGRYGKAEPLHKRALAINEKVLGPEHPDTANSLWHLALLYDKQGRYGEAEPLHKRALAINEKVLGPGHPVTANSLSSLALLYVRMGRYGEAQPLYKRAVAINRLVLNNYNQQTLDSLAQLELLYDRLGRYTQEWVLKLTLSAYEKVQGPEHPDTANSLKNLATLYWRQGRYGKAEPLHKRALAINEKVLGPEHPDTANSLWHLALLYDKQGRYGEAEPLHKRALAINEKVLGPGHPVTANSLSSLALLHLVQKRNAPASTLISRLNVNQAQWLRREIPLQPRELRAGLLAEQSDAPAITFALLDQDPEARELALESRLNRQGLLAEIERRQRQLAASTPATQDLAERIAWIDQQLASVNLPAERRPLLRLERQRLEAELYRVLPSLLIEPVSTQQVASALKAVAADGVLVEFQKFHPYIKDQQGKPKWGDARYVALLLKPDGSIAFVALGEAAAIDAAVSAALLETVRNELDPAPLWAQVSRLVLGPLQSHLVSGQQVFLSPDGELHRVPFAALPSLRDPNRRLGDDLRLSVLTSGRDLLRLQKPAGAGGPSVLMANPRYDAIGRSTAPAPSERASGERRGLQQRTGELTSGTIWKPLPATEEEARLLSPLLQVERPITAEQATAARALQQRAPRIFHIATHGFFQPDPAAAGTPQGSLSEDPLLRSGLVLAGANHPDADPADDGYLTAAEATAMDLEGTELVTLSACETGLGDVRSGEGVYGLQRALTVAGSRSTLLSLWKVPDAPTRDFMAAYYGRLRQGEGRAEALLNTQAAFRNHSDPDYREMYVWAAFQLTGDWRPIGGW